MYKIYPIVKMYYVYNIGWIGKQTIRINKYEYGTINKNKGP